jgi:hypothetical protein
MCYGRRSIKSKKRDKKREGDAERERERERESCSNVFGVRCGYNGVRRVRLNALRSQIDNKNTDKRKRDWWALNPPGYFPDWHIGVCAKESKRLVAFITRVPAHIRAHEKIVLMAEINFLCDDQGGHTASALAEYLARSVYNMGCSPHPNSYLSVLA